VSTRYDDTTFKHLLVPIWISAYRFNGKVYRYLVNGQNGRASGTAPWSVAKIVLFVLAILAVIGAVVACLGILNGR
jgi:hypothetical protein